CRSGTVEFGMAQSDGQEQPSMEEILASIRRIISEDEAVESERPALSVADEQPEEDVLELTDRVEQPDARAKDQSASEAEAAQAAPADRPGRRPAVSEPTAEASAAEGLLSGQAAAAAVA